MSTEDPREIYKRPPYSDQQQPPPGSEEKMSPRADHGESSYQGTGRLKGRTALVTGADSGIGRAVALAFAREGADVAIAYLDEHDDAAETQRVGERADRRALPLPGDVPDNQHCAELVRKTVGTFGRIDVLVNNAAFQGKTVERFEELT